MRVPEEVPVQIPDILTTVPVLAATGAVLLVLVVGLAVVRWHRGRARPRDEAQEVPTPTPEVDLHAVRREEADQLRSRWTALQGDFVDAPADTLHRADVMVCEAMRACGYPATDADGRIRLLVEHEPAHAPRYRDLRRAIAQPDELDTEQRRQVLLHARTLFDALLRGDHARQERLFAA